MADETAPQTEPTEDLPREAGQDLPPPRPNSKDALIHPHYDLLGKVSDKVVGEKAGVSAATVKNFRDFHGITAYRRGGASKKKTSKPTRRKARTSRRRAAAKSKGKPGRKSKIEPFHHLVGALSDAEVAQQAGAAVASVSNYRRRHGIPAPSRATREKPAESAKKPAPPRKAARAKRGSAYAWKVILESRGEQRERLVVAPDPVQAAQLAQGAGLGDLVAMERSLEVVG